MWPICNLGLSSFLWLFIPLILGLLTAWWAWGGRREDTDYAYAAPAAEPVRPVPAAPAPAPVAAPVAEPVAKPAVAPVAAAAAVAMTAIGIPAAIGDPDDLRLVKGIGPKLNDLLISLGIRRFDQIAAWGREQVDKVDDHLGAFKGRIDRDNWIDQAGFLAKNDIKGFEAKYGAIDHNNT